MGCCGGQCPVWDMHPLPAVVPLCPHHGALLRARGSWIYPEPWSMTSVLGGAVAQALARPPVTCFVFAGQHSALP